MSLTIASSAEESAAGEKVIAHHRDMLDTVRPLVDSVLLAVVEGDDPGPCRENLLRWCRSELLPHMSVEEKVLYPAARGTASLLIDAMLDEHARLGSLIDEVSAQRSPVRIAAAARALLAVLESHIGKENEQITPLLVADRGHSVFTLLKAMHQSLETSAPAAEQEYTSGREAGPDYPVLDARAVPHAIRHAAVFGALDAVRLGRGLILVAPHDPLPLLGQLEKRSPEMFSVSYLERGPEAWRLKIERVKAS